MKKARGIKYPTLLLFGLWFICFSCHHRSDTKSESVSEEIIENEIWNPIIIFTRKEKKIIQAKSKKLYKQKNKSALKFQ